MVIPPLDKQGYRKFALIMATFIALVFGLFFPWVLEVKPLPRWPWMLSALFTVWALVLPKTLVLIYTPWMFFGQIIGQVNTKVLLILVFYLVFTPISLMLKILGKDPMHRKIEASRNSYWKTSEVQPKNHMENLY